jgi:hypothetical protein
MSYHILTANVYVDVGVTEMFAVGNCVQSRVGIAHARLSKFHSYFAQTSVLLITHSSDCMCYDVGNGAEGACMVLSSQVRKTSKDIGKNVQ